MVTTEDICEAASVKSDESFPLRRIKLDAIAFILGMVDMDNNNNNNEEAETNLEDEFDSLRETVKELFRIRYN